MRRFVLLAAAMIPVLGYAAPATAQPRGSAIVDAAKGTFAYDFVVSDLCDFDVRIVGTENYDFRVREGRGGREQAFFAHNTSSFTDTLSANGRHVTATARQTSNEVRAVPLGGGLFQFSDIRAGRLAVMDAEGRLLGHEAGVIRSTYTFDTLNDDEPGGTVVGEIDETRHGRFDDLDALVCSALKP